MYRRKLLIGLATAGIFLTAFGSAAGPASADQRTLLVTLLGGAQITVTVDVPAGTPIDQIQIPGVTTPIVSVQDITPQQPTPAQPPQPQPEAGADPGQGDAPQASQPAPSSTNGGAPTKNDSPNTPTQEPQAAKQVQQETTGKTRKPQPPVEAEKKKPAADTAKKKKAKDAIDKAAARVRQPDGIQTPGTSSFEALPVPAPVEVPNFFIDKFRIPPFLLPIYQAAGIEYGVRWEVLAAINEIETDYGRNLNVSTAGALGWMQFMPGTWKQYGVDANHDGRKDPYNPVDAIFAAARYLKAANAETDVRRAVFAYNRLVRRLRPLARESHRRPARRPRRLAHRPHPGSLPGARQGSLRRRHLRARRQEASEER
jgi:outer membrane biosynthesis protein TonB